jgi:uncharacterized protein (DUF433 family)
LVGKPVVKGTRISVELVLSHLAANPDLAELIAAYPELTVQDVQAALAYARELVSKERARALPATIATRPAGEALLGLAKLGEELSFTGPPDLSARIDDYLYGDEV